ncbi:hypothetical protein JCM30471_12840 [Desulfuromonas carbonis]|uniref:divergent polysaccharide deacetylase family protein n=1 Tax=Desulfuromonas sp. DDH964 TaxID=1823759 RepID=UPI00078D824D|nr:divergent polysaccharide deacetylase family protein [Desulfuromonas sp. DDH964]AMV72768.1 hypothetical protein DBW_2431 [Desulfuromonas sp. DDH964]
MSARKKPSRRKSPRRSHGGSLTLKLWLAGVFLVGFVLVSLILLGELRSRYLSPTVPPPSPSAGAPATPPQVTEGTRWEEIRRRLESAGWRGERFDAEPGAASWEYRVARPIPPSTELAAMAESLCRLPGVEAELLPGRGLRILHGDHQQGAILFQPPAPPAQPGRSARVAIIVDDLGRDVATLRQFLGVKVPLTLAILPNETHARESARLAHETGHEVLIHIPMEPQGYPAVNPGHDALFVAASADELRQRFQGYLTAVPFAVGGNNHMGSRFTEDPAGMAVVLGQMREAGLFFVDSRTTGASVAFELARRAGIPVAQRDMFLDNVQDAGLIGGEIRKLIRMARQHGSAIGICHPHPATLTALRQALPELRAAGIEVVPVSQLVAVPTAPQ